jgi:hypothetical protein
MRSNWMNGKNLNEKPSDANSGGGTVGDTTTDETKTPETLDVREKDDYFGSTLQKESVAKAVEAGNITLEPQSKTQKTRGKGSRELTYNWNDIKFNNFDGVLAYVGGDENRLLGLLSDYASDIEQQQAWEVLFEVTDEEKLIRQAARRIAQVLNISEDAAVEQVKAMISAKAKEVAEKVVA